VALLVTGCATARPIPLTGAAQVPPVTTAATGTTDISINGYKSIFGTVRTSGVVGTAAHIHMGAVGKTGGVVIPLVKKDANTWVPPSNASVSDAALAAYNAGELYVNVHSDANKGGEIRAQLKPRP